MTDIKDDVFTGIYGIDGKPQIFQDPAMDRFIASFINAVSELWVQKEELLRLMDLLIAKGVLTQEELSTYTNDPETRNNLHQQARAFIDQIYSPLRESKS